MSGETVTVLKTMDAPASEVWAALITPETIKRCFFGSLRSVRDGKRYEDKGEIRDVEKERPLSFTHWSEMCGKPDRPGDMEQTRKNWRAALDGLKKSVGH